MAERDDSLPPWVLLGLTLSALMGGGGLLYAAIHLAATAAAPWLILTFELLLAVLGAIATGVAALTAGTAALKTAADRLDALAKRYPTQLKAVRERTPVFVGVLLLVSEGLVIVADNSFEGNTLTTLVVSFVLLIGLAAVNELIIRKRVLYRLVGVFLWLVLVAFLPYAIMIDRHWSLGTLLGQWWALDLGTKLFFGITGLVLVVLPIITASITDA